MKQAEETNKTFQTCEESQEPKAPISNGGAGITNSETKRHSLAWIPVLAIIVSVAIMITSC